MRAATGKPPPAGPGEEGAPSELTNDAITADFRLLQRRRGHRYSLDDLATAWEGARAAPEARTFLDLGCGIGSVLLMVGWRLPEARIFGVEAQEVSFDLARRNVEMNGVAARATLLLGDLREVTRRWPHPRCDLVTGTPPYLPKGTALPSPDAQRTAARIELRGGVEDYLAAAARVVAAEGRVVVCSDARSPERVLRGAREAALSPLRRRDVVPRAGLSRPLFSVWTLSPAESAGEPEIERATLVIRDEAGNLTAEGAELRRFFGLG
jgi:tRNA1Val (adenine37-N6)-methyltransferase